MIRLVVLIEVSLVFGSPLLFSEGESDKIAIVSENSMQNTSAVVFAESGQLLVLSANFKPINNTSMTIFWEPNSTYETFSNRTKNNQMEAFIKIPKYDVAKDGSRFTCFLKTMSGIVSKSIEIVSIDQFVYIDHKLWHKTKSQIEIFARTRTVIRITTIGFIANYSVKWYSTSKSIFKRSNTKVKFVKQNLGEVSNLTLANLEKSDTGFYTTFYRNIPYSWPKKIFKLIVLNTIQLRMNSSHYFQSTSNASRVIVCRVYGNTNESLQFVKRCDHAANCSGTDEVISNGVKRLKSPDHIFGYFSLLLRYPYESTEIIECRAIMGNKTVNSVQSLVTIAAYSAALTVLKVFKNATRLDINTLADPIVRKKAGEILVLECAVCAQQYSNLTWLNEKGDDFAQLRARDHLLTTNRTLIQSIEYRTATLRIKTATQESKQFNYSCVAFEIFSKLYRVKNVTLLIEAIEPKFTQWFIVPVAVVVVLQICLIIGLILRHTKRKPERNIFELRQARCSSLRSMYDYIKEVPYDKAFEFPKHRLQIGKCLGSGNFGMVNEAWAKRIIREEAKSIVAVKTVKKTNENMDADALASLVSEMKILIHLGKHVNVVNLLGAITKNLSQGELMVIVEFCPHGSLEKYLKKNRQIFVNLIDPETDEIDSARRHSASDGYLPMDAGRVQQSGATSTTMQTDYSKLTTVDLIMWAFQICRGMNYIGSRNILHGDLAARNILLANDNIVKICDFGLSKSFCGQDGSYTLKAGIALPIKWLALESLRDLEFSIKSDVWSYGILLWEMFSLGVAPYPGISARGLEFLNLLEGGHRMQKPPYANQQIYQIMWECWIANASERPKFSEIEKAIAQLIPKTMYSHYLDLSEPYERANKEYFKSQGDDEKDSLTLLTAATDANDNAETHYANQH